MCNPAHNLSCTFITSPNALNFQCHIRNPTYPANTISCTFITPLTPLNFQCHIRNSIYPARTFSGTFVIEYVGEILEIDEFEERTLRYSASEHFYFMALNGKEIIDASRKGNSSRFINHSCEPNCETQKVWQRRIRYSI